MEHLQTLLDALKQAKAQSAGILSASDTKTLALLVQKVEKRLQTAMAA